MTSVDDPAYYAYLVSLAFEQGYYAALDNPSTQRNPFFEWLGSDVRVRLVAASGWDAVTSAEDPEFTGWLTHCEHRRGREVHRNYDFRTVRHHHFEQDQERAFEVMNARFGGLDDEAPTKPPIPHGGGVLSPRTHRTPWT